VEDAYTGFGSVSSTGGTIFCPNKLTSIDSPPITSKGLLKKKSKTFYRLVFLNVNITAMILH